MSGSLVARLESAPKTSESVAGVLSNVMDGVALVPVPVLLWVTGADVFTDVTSYTSTAVRMALFDVFTVTVPLPGLLPSKA